MLHQSAQLEPTPINAFSLITGICGGASLLAARGVHGKSFKSDTRKRQTFKSVKAANIFLEARRLDPS